LTLVDIMGKYKSNCSMGGIKFSKRIKFP